MSNTPCDPKCFELAQYFYPNATKVEQMECAGDIQDAVETFGEFLDREPAEPDGECFRGGEAAAYEAEQMAEWQRLK